MFLWRLTLLMAASSSADSKGGELTMEACIAVEAVMGASGEI
jgi:hypothetical protein